MEISNQDENQFWYNIYIRMLLLSLKNARYNEKCITKQVKFYNKI